MRDAALAALPKGFSMTRINQTLVSITALSALMVMSSQSASAADLGGRYEPEPVHNYAPAPDPYWNWTGLYFGGNVGYGFADVGSSLDRITAPVASLGSTGALTSDGMFGGVQLGYNWQRERLVFGLETDFQFADMQDSAFGSNPAFAGDAAVDIDSFGTVRGRVGLADGRTLYYLTGGLAYADVDFAQVGIGLGNAIAVGDNKTMLGYTVGGGIEHALSQNLSLKLEYQYLDFGDAKFSGTDLGGNSYASKVDVDMHTVRAGVNYKF